MLAACSQHERKEQVAHESPLEAISSHSSASKSRARSTGPGPNRAPPCSGGTTAGRRHPGDGFRGLPCAHKDNPKGLLREGGPPPGWSNVCYGCACRTDLTHSRLRLRYGPRGRIETEGTSNWDRDSARKSGERHCTEGQNLKSTKSERQST